MKSDEFTHIVAKGDIGPLYFLYGDDQYLVEQGVKRLMDRIVDPGFRDFNFNVFYGNECKGDEIFSAAQTLPMFAERRVILIKKAHELPATALEVLTGYIQNPSASTCLVLQADKIDQRKKFFTEFKKFGELVEFKKPYDNQLGPFIREETKSRGKRIDPAAAELLAFLVGNNLQELASQIEKVVTFIGSREMITTTDIKGIVSDTKVDSVFEFSDAVGEKSLGKALRTLQTILRDGEAPLLILAILTRHFRQLWKVRELVDRKLSSSDISKATGINPYFLKKVVTQAGNFTPMEIKSIFERLFDLDLLFKSGGGKQMVLLEQLVLDICTKK
jgi:DNA polymerase-3 subunit delta